MGAARIKSARRWTKRTYQILVATNQFNHCFAHLLCIRFNSTFKLCLDSVLGCIWADLTITTKSSLLALILWCRKISLTVLLILFRLTALGNTLLLATTPSLAWDFSFWTKKTLKYSSSTDSARITWTNPSLRNNRCEAENPKRELNSKSGTPSRTTSTDNGTAPACFHSYQKTMSAFSFGYGRLVSSFHDIFLGK